MFIAIRSCSSSSSSLFFTHRSLSLPLKKLILKPYYSLGSSVFSTKHFSQKSLFFFNPIVNPRSIAMASRPSAFDLLMARKKPQQKQQKSSRPRNARPPLRKTLVHSRLLKLRKPRWERMLKTMIPAKLREPRWGKVKIWGKLWRGTKKPRVVVSPNESLVELKKEAMKKKKEAMKKKLKKKEAMKKKLKKKKEASFDPKKAVYWGEGQRVPFMFVAKAMDAISKETARIVITEIACNMLSTVI